MPILDLRQLDFVAMRSAGYNGAVFDKDNCLVRPPAGISVEDTAR